MKFISSFQTDVLRKVVSKARKPLVDRLLSLDAEEALTAVIPGSTKKRTLYLLSSLTLVDVGATTVTLLTGGTTTHTLRLVPGEAQVLPIAIGISSMSVTSNSASLGTIRMVVV
jgi:hypothetical protein